MLQILTHFLFGHSILYWILFCINWMPTSCLMTFLFIFSWNLLTNFRQGFLSNYIWQMLDIATHYLFMPSHGKYFCINVPAKISKLLCGRISPLPTWLKGRFCVNEYFSCEMQYIHMIYVKIPYFTFVIHLQSFLILLFLWLSVCNCNLCCSVQKINHYFVCI